MSDDGRHEGVRGVRVNRHGCFQVLEWLGCSRDGRHEGVGRVRRQ